MYVFHTTFRKSLTRCCSHGRSLLLFVILSLLLSSISCWALLWKQVLHMIFRTFFCCSSLYSIFFPCAGPIVVLLLYDLPNSLSYIRSHSVLYVARANIDAMVLNRCEHDASNFSSPIRDSLLQENWNRMQHYIFSSLSLSKEKLTAKSSLYANLCWHINMDFVQRIICEVKEGYMSFEPSTAIESCIDNLLGSYSQ